MITLTKEEAGLYLFKYQNLYNPRKFKSDKEIVNFIKKIGCIQYDPLSKTARNADLVLQSRCKDYSEETLYRLLYKKRELIDGWDKNMSIWPIQDWPFFSRKRNEQINNYKKRGEEFKFVRETIKEKINENVYICSKDININQKVDWSWAPTNIGRAVLESMYHSGELVIHHKKGTRKYYGLTENLIPSALLNKSDPNTTTANYYQWYVKRRIKSVGLLWDKASDAWLGFNLKKEERQKAIKELLDKDEIIELKITDIDEKFHLPKQELQLLENSEIHYEAAVIAPLDNLIWDRKLISKLYNFDYKWEVYTPSKDRKYGYYILPVIYNGNFIARFEPIMYRKSKEIIFQNWWWEQDIRKDQNMTNALIRCITDFVQFLNVEKISLSNSLSGNEFKWILDCI
jgi:uncharacterized protein